MNIKLTRGEWEYLKKCLIKYLSNLLPQETQYGDIVKTQAFQINKKLGNEWIEDEHKID
jgi:hypothetical protein